MLELRGVEACYGSSQALFGVNLGIEQGEVVTLLGRNGMGKTTTVRSIMGLVEVTKGEVLFEGQKIQSLPSYAVARLGIGLVPEGRQIFPNLTVRENLIATSGNYSQSDDPYTLDRVFAIFPRLKERITHFGNQLSGGEQQMLAIGRAMMINPKVLILDEATEGLAPLIREEIWRGIRTLKSRGEAILVIDKNLDALMKLADRHYIMEKGQVVWSGDSQALRSDTALQERYLGV
ncbi:MAG: ABC transporter ATP-binding protein [Sedimenticola sp.]|jgi:branched-chain amino acid transport system ATP-binding protein|nr:MAG: ABC transporter ATP-binding protein [Sedimenticola sp.]